MTLDGQIALVLRGVEQRIAVEAASSKDLDALEAAAMAHGLCVLQAPGGVYVLYRPGTAARPA